MDYEKTGVGPGLTSVPQQGGDCKGVEWLSLRGDERGKTSFDKVEDLGET